MPELYDLPVADTFRDDVASFMGDAETRVEGIRRTFDGLRMALSSARHALPKARVRGADGIGAMFEALGKLEADARTYADMESRMVASTYMEKAQVSRYGLRVSDYESWTRFYVLPARLTDAEALYLVVAATGAGESYSGPGRGFSSEPYVARRSRSRVLVYWTGGLDI